jgi:hypothetical protein
LLYTMDIMHLRASCEKPSPPPWTLTAESTTMDVDS